MQSTKSFVGKMEKFNVYNKKDNVCNICIEKWMLEDYNSI